jgi:hypothetical protein
LNQRQGEDAGLKNPALRLNLNSAALPFVPPFAAQGKKYAAVRLNLSSKAATSAAQEFGI